MICLSLIVNKMLINVDPPWYLICESWCLNLHFWFYCSSLFCVLSFQKEWNRFINYARRFRIVQAFFGNWILVDCLLYKNGFCKGEFSQMTSFLCFQSPRFNQRQLEVSILHNRNRNARADGFMLNISEKHPK